MTLRMNWGAGIALVYSLFASATVAFVVFALHTPADLVSADYYQRSLREDEHNAAIRNALALGAGADRARAPGDRALVLTIPREQVRDASGVVTLYRASDVRADRHIPLEVDDQGIQRLSLEGLPTGRWIAKVEWTSGGLPYYLEQPVVTPSPWSLPAWRSASPEAVTAPRCAGRSCSRCVSTRRRCRRARPPPVGWPITRGASPCTARWGSSRVLWAGLPSSGGSDARWQSRQAPR